MITAVLVEVYFRMSYLKKLEVAEDVDFERRVSSLQYIIDNKSRGKVIALAVLYLLFAVLIGSSVHGAVLLGLNLLSGALVVVGRLPVSYTWLHFPK